MSYDAPSYPGNALDVQAKLASAMDQYKPRTKMERLKDAKAGLEAKLKEVNKAIALLQDNPQINEVIEALERAGV